MTPTPITRVTLHRDGALVHRQGTASARNGRIDIPGLPLLVDDASLRVSVQGAALQSAQLELDPADLPACVEDPIGRLDADRRHRALELRRGVLERQRAVVDELRPAAPNAQHGPIPSPEQLVGWAQLEEVLQPWADALDAELAKVQRQLDEVRAVIEGPDGARAAAARALPGQRLVLQVDRDGEVAIAISYRVDGACWTPAYALRTDSTFRQGRLILRALVAQATGEDWRDVELSLSTAPCRRRVHIPDLPAMRLGTRQPAAESPWRELPAGFEELFPRDLGDDAASRQGVPGWEASAAPPELQPMGSGASRSKRLALPSFFTRVEGAAPEAPDTPPEPAGPLQLDAEALDYPLLRLASFTEPRGQRGRLERADARRLAQELGVTPAAAVTLVEARRHARRRADDLRMTELPPHCAPPAPVNGLDLRFEAEGPVDIPGDGRFHPISVGSEELHLDVRHRSIPRLDTRVFRTVYATRESDRPLLPGPVDVHVDGALILAAPWPGSEGGGRMELALGVEPGIRVTRQVSYREEMIGIFANDRRVHTEIAVHVRSSLSRAAQLELVERVPVPSDADLQVEVVEAEPADEAWPGSTGTPLQGARVQRLSLPAGGEASARLHYAVTMGARMEIVGGDRRG